MARQAGPLFFEGTIGGITFYRMEGMYYSRRKTSLTKARVLSDKAFERSRQAAKVFGRASKLASQIYRMLDRTKRKHGLMGVMSGAANRLLHQGMNEAEVVLVLMKEYAKIELKEITVKEEKKCEQALHQTPQPEPFVESIFEFSRLFAPFHILFEPDQPEPVPN